MSHPFKVKSGAPSRHSLCGPSVGGTPPWFSQCERREEKLAAPQLQLMNSPSINDECQTQQLFGLLRGRESDVNRGHSRAANTMWPGGITLWEDVRRTPQQMSLCPFKHFPNCGGGHLRSSSSCHFLSPPLTFGSLGCVPCTDAGSWDGNRGYSLRQGQDLSYNLKIKKAPLRIIQEKNSFCNRC